MDVERFCAQARKLGDRCELVGYDSATHGFFNPQRDEGKWYRETLAEADRFLTELGYLRKHPPDSLRELEREELARTGQTTVSSRHSTA